jgi:hypothetical protein
VGIVSPNHYERSVHRSRDGNAKEAPAKNWMATKLWPKIIHRHAYQCYRIEQESPGVTSRMISGLIWKFVGPGVQKIATKNVITIGPITGSKTCQKIQFHFQFLGFVWKPLSPKFTKQLRSTINFNRGLMQVTLSPCHKALRLALNLHSID